MDENDNEIKLCRLFLLEDGSCVNVLPSGTTGSINVTHCNSKLETPIDFDLYKHFVEEQEDGSLVCKLWSKPEYTSTSIILPAIVFVFLCVLLFIMIYQNLKERSYLRQQYLANYKELDGAGGQTDIQKPSRVPHQEFTCGGMKINFQMCSNLGNQKKVNDVKPSQQPSSQNELKV